MSQSRKRRKHWRKSFPLPLPLKRSDHVTLRLEQRYRLKLTSLEDYLLFQRAVRSDSTLLRYGGGGSEVREVRFRDLRIIVAVRDGNVLTVLPPE